MKNQEVEKRVSTAIEHAAPDKLEDVMSKCGKQTGTVSYDINITDRKNTKPIVRIVSAVAAVAVLAVFVYFIAGGFFGNNSGKGSAGNVDSVIMLDVNPSISISIDESEKVLSVDPKNDDARKVLGDMDLINVYLDVAVNALIGSMLQNGYLDEIHNSILVSVENSNEARSEQIREKVAAAINKCMNSDHLNGAVLSQTVSNQNNELKTLSEKYDISLGKAQLINEIIAKDATISFEDLADLSVNQIALISESKQLGSESVTQTGTASSKEYITREKAFAIAYAKAGVTVDQAKESEIEFDSEKGIMVYEIEFRIGAVEYDYKVNAVTGEIVKEEIENDRDESNIGNTGNTDGQSSTVTPSYIGEDAAKQVAMTDLGYTDADVAFADVSVEYDDGYPEYYKVKIYIGNTKHTYKIALTSETILAHSVKNNDTTQNGTTATNYIGESRAKEIALAHANVTESEVSRINVEFDFDDGGVVYEIEFNVGVVEYEYEINAATGDILKSESEIDD